MAETAALFWDKVLPDVTLCQWVTSFPFPLRDLLATHHQAMIKVLSITYRLISPKLIRKAGYRLTGGGTDAMTLIKRFGSVLNLNVQFDILFLDGVYVYRNNRFPRFQRVKTPNKKGATSAGSADQSARRSLSETPGLAIAGYREHLAGTWPSSKYGCHA